MSSPANDGVLVTVTREIPELIATLSLEVVNLPENVKSDTPLPPEPLCHQDMLLLTKFGSSSARPNTPSPNNNFISLSLLSLAPRYTGESH